jgi:brefeldin A-resistance guanine nucleotide exchange factor 1
MLAVRDEETVKELAKDVADALATVIRNASNLHPVVIARAVYYLLVLLKASNVSPLHVPSTHLLTISGI